MSCAEPNGGGKLAVPDVALKVFGPLGGLLPGWKGLPLCRITSPSNNGLVVGPTLAAALSDGSHITPITHALICAKSVSRDVW